jgi:peptidoglycan/xylan/chitin deacetylase (PgdA/CDA1 family)
MKKLIQRIIRNFNKILFSKEMPNKIVIYFHETTELEVIALKKIIKYFQDLDYEFCNVRNLNLDNKNKQIALTFDDAFLNWENTLPLFRENNIKATFFLNTIQFSTDDKTKFLSDTKIGNHYELISKDVLVKIAQDDHEIGSHTHSHRNLSNLNMGEFKDEVDKNLNILKDFNIYPSGFAVPFGMRRFVTNEQKKELKKIFNYICMGEPGMLYKHTKDVFQRYPWRIELPFQENIDNLKIDSSKFNNLTKRSGLG